MLEVVSFWIRMGSRRKCILFDDVYLVRVPQLLLILADQVFGDCLVERANLLQSVFRPVHCFLYLIPLLGVGRFVSREHVVMSCQLIRVFTP